MSQGVFMDRNFTTRPQIPSSSVNNQLLVSSAALSKNAKMTVSEDKRQTPYGTAGSTALTGSSQRMESYNYPVKQPASSNITQADHASNTQIPHSKQGYLHQQLLNHTQYSSNQQQSSQQSSSSPYSRSNNTAAFGSLTRNTSNTSNGSNNNNNNHSGSFQQKQQTQLAYKIQQQNQNQQQQQQQQQLQHRRNQTNMENVTKNQQFLEYLNTAINVKAAKAISPKVAAGKSIHNTNTNFNNACVSSQLSTKQMTQKQLKSNNKPTQITTITSATTTTTVPITTNQQSTPSANVQKQQQQSHILLNQITKPTNSSISNNNNNCKNSHLKRQNLMLARETQKTQATVAAPPPSNLIDKNLSCKSYSPVIRQTQTLQGDHSHREIDLISNGSKLPIQPSQTTQMFQQWHSIPSQHQDRQLGISSSSTSTGKRTKQRNNSEQLVASRQQQSSQQQQQFLQVTKSIIQEQQQQSAQLEQKLSQLAQKKQIQQISSSSCSGVSGDTAQLKRLSHKNDKINENTEVTDKNINISVKNACSSSPNGLFFSDDNKQKILLDSKKFFSLAPQSSITTTIKNTQNNNLDSNTSPSNTDFFHKKQASSTKHASSNTLGSLSNTLTGSSVIPNNITTIPSSTHHNGNKSNPLSINNNYLIENKPRSQVSTGIIKHDYNTMKYTSDNTQTTKDQRISPNKKRKEDEDNQNAEDSNQYQLPLKRNNNAKVTGEGIQLDNNNNNIISNSNYNNIRQPQQQQQQQIQSIIQEIPVGESSNPLSESLSSSSCSSSNIPMASDNQHELSGLQYMSSTMLLRSSSSSREPNRRYERQYSEKQQEINDKIKHILDQRNNSNSAHSQELSWRSPYTLSQELNQRQQYPQQLKANCYKNNQKNQDNCRESIMMQSIVDTNKEYFNSNSNEYNRNMQGNNNNNINNPRQNNDDHTPNRNKIDGNTSVSNSSKKNKIHLKGYSSGQQTAVTPSTCDGKHLNQAHLGSASSVAISHFVISGSSPSNNVQMSTQPYLTTENDDDIRIVLEDQFKTESSQQDCFKTDRTAILTERDLNCRESQLQEYKELENDDDGDRENERNEDKRNFSYEMYEENEDDEEEEEEQDVKVQDRKKGNNEDEYNDESVKIKQLQENQQKYQVNQQQISQKQPETEVSAKLEKRLMNLETEMSSVISRCLHLENMNNSLAENIFKISSQRDQILNENEQYRIRINELMATNRLQEDTISALLGRVQKEQAKGKDLNLSQLKTNRNKTETSNNNNMNSTFEGSHHHWDKNIGFCESLSANAGNTSSHLANSNRINNTTTCCNSNPSTTSAGSRQKKDVNQYFSSIIASTQSTNTQPQTFQGYLSQKSAGTLGLADFKQHDYYLSARHGLVNQQTKQ